MAILRFLTIEVGAEEQVLPLGEGPLKLGRADDNDVVLLEQAASRHHARIEPVEGGFEIVDLGSSAGLTLRGEKVQRHRLQDGDELTIGATRLRFVANPGSEATIVPTATPKPSSQPTQAAVSIPPPPNPFADAETMLPTDLPAGASTQDPALADTGPNQSLGGTETVAATHEPARPPVDSSPATVHAPHEPAPPPSDASPATVHAAHEPNPPAPTPIIEPVVSNNSPPKSSPSFVMGGDGSSSPSDYTLEGGGADASGYSLKGGGPGADASGYSLEGDRGGGMGGLSMDTVPPSGLSSSGPGAGSIVLFGLVGAAASFGILVALQGVPW